MAKHIQIKTQTVYVVVDSETGEEVLTTTDHQRAQEEVDPVTKIVNLDPKHVARLGEVFDLVKTRPNWKDPIAAIVYKDNATKEEIVEAVTFYCGGVPEVFDLGHAWRVSGAGYYVWCGA